MTPDEARERMNEALDGELSTSEQAAFERVLAADAALREEYDDLTRFVAETRALGTQKPVEGVDLLAGVQQRLRERSGGKFYRDRFAEVRGRAKGPGNTVWMLALAFIFVLAAGAWLAFDAGLLSPPQITP